MLTITHTNKRTRKHIKINFNRLFASLLVLTLIITCMGLYVDFCRFPDKYITTWKYQLKNEIASGNEKAIDYYNKHYISKGVYLYGEESEPESDFLNLATVTDFEATEHGVLLHTEDGNGYFIEK